MFTRSAWSPRGVATDEYLRLEAVADAAPGWNDAVAVQRALMPPPLHTGAFVSLAATTVQCQPIGGDFYDYLDAGIEVRLMLGDVCGKGTPAALQAAWVQGILSTAMELRARPADAIAHLNRALCRRQTCQRFVTLFYGVVTADRRLTYCNAGQCCPMLVNDQWSRELTIGGMPPGMFGDTRYEEESLRLEKGETLVVFSDGVSEASRQNEDFGHDRIADIAKACSRLGPSAIVNALMNGARNFAGLERQRDDMSVMAVRCNP